jgi:hypothetical protein
MYTASPPHSLTAAQPRRHHHVHSLTVTHTAPLPLPHGPKPPVTDSNGTKSRNSLKTPRDHTHTHSVKPPETTSRPQVAAHHHRYTAHKLTATHTAPLPHGPNPPVTASNGIGTAHNHHGHTASRPTDSRPTASRPTQPHGRTVSRPTQTTRARLMATSNNPETA